MLIVGLNISVWVRFRVRVRLGDVVYNCPGRVASRQYDVIILTLSDHTEVIDHANFRYFCTLALIVGLCGAPPLRHTRFFFKNVILKF